MQVSGFLFGTAVRADRGWNSFADMIAAARKDPGKLTFSTSGIATTNHIAMEELCEREGVSMTHIPFRGSQEGVTALLGKQIDIVADSSSWRPNVETGELKLLSVWTRERLVSFPQVPTLLDLGYGMVVTSPYGIVGPKGLPPELIDTLHRSFKKAYEDESAQAVVRRWEMPREYLNSADYLAFVKERVEYEKKMVAKLGLSID
jgi:tripartite-type tricarboxylate transporter receptor subunit TctC